MKTAIATAIAFAATALTIAPAHAEETTRVMVVGDSVTHGQDGNYTWRYFASKQLGNRVDFVGPNRGTIDGEDIFGGGYADPDFDQDHAARWGLSMWETLYWNSDTAPSVASLMASDPQVVVITLGFNDLIGMNQSPEQTIGHMREIVTRARAVDPGVDFVLGSLPQEWYEQVADYNRLLPALVEELDSGESNVVGTPVAALELGVDTYDAAHPTTDGERLIADAMLAGLADAGVVPAPAAPEPEDVPATPVPDPEPLPVVEAIAPPPAVVLPAVEPAPAEVAPIATAPERPRGVKAKRVGKAVRVKWRTVDSADTYRIQCGGKSTTTSKARTKIRTHANRCKVTAVNEAGKSRPTVVRLP